jgi:hypothetical protein
MGRGLLLRRPRRQWTGTGLHLKDNEAERVVGKGADQRRNAQDRCPTWRSFRSCWGREIATPDHEVGAPIGGKWSKRATEGTRFQRRVLGDLALRWRLIRTRFLHSETKWRRR